ncbi:hypothetical protein D3C77_377210 [compost metagenome]
MNDPDDLAFRANNLSLAPAIIADEIIPLPIRHQGIAQLAYACANRFYHHQYLPGIRFIARRYDGQFLRRTLDVTNAVVGRIDQITMLQSALAQWKRMLKIHAISRRNRESPRLQFQMLNVPKRHQIRSFIGLVFLQLNGDLLHFLFLRQLNLSPD